MRYAGRQGDRGHIRADLAHEDYRHLVERSVRLGEEETCEAVAQSQGGTVRLDTGTKGVTRVRVTLPVGED